MLTAKQVLLAGIFGLSAAYELPRASSLSRFFNQLPLGFGQKDVDASRFKWLLVLRHQPLVEIESICYDDLGKFGDFICNDNVVDTGDDERWKPFCNISKVLEDNYPLVYDKASVKKVNTFGLVYTVAGSDPSLKPILLTAHQDVVPVESETVDLWDYPPFSAHYN
ncbi:hypothetical protein A9Z42_0075900 [Trichoderma parareesei]|uniref:Peptidase M20 dimerisation domain-containing protein n=1 Tax=Trichoderma parareesei TaxID=858221 RepID=A0A2H2ZHL4_TRIPA|nr:hypothetical protein A9Z42_0075900 [Trichoderma parareesei]